MGIGSDYTVDGVVLVKALSLYLHPLAVVVASLYRVIIQ